MRESRRRVQAVALTLAVGLLAACKPAAQPDTPAPTTIQQRIDQHDYAGAIADAKNALRVQPANAESRRLLGIALLQARQAPAAMLELRKALELGAADAATVPWIAKAMLAQRELRQLIAEFGATELSDAAASADLRTAVATAHLMLGENDKARESIAAALDSLPNHTDARLVSARLTATSDPGTALAQVNEVLAAQPRSIDALLLRGDLARHFSRDVDKALADYRAAAAAAPDSVPAGIAVTSLLIQQGRTAEADVELARLKAIAPRQADVRLLEARLALAAKNPTRALEISTDLLKAAPGHPALLELAGECELQLGVDGAAENNLSLAMRATPKAAPPRQLLAQLYLRQGRAARALEVLEPLLAGDKQESRTLLLAGQAHQRQGDLARAEALFARAAQQDPDDASVRVDLAASRLANGRNPGAIAELEALAASDTGQRANLALISARLRSGDAAAAMKEIDALEAKQPNRPLPLVLRGQLQMRRKDWAAARGSFDRASKLDATYFPAIASLAELDVAEGQPARAQQRLESFLRTEPRHPRALLSLAELKARANGPLDETAKLFADAARAGGADPAGWVGLVNHLLQRQQPKQALAAAEDAVAALPADPAVLRMLGLAQMSAGHAQQAVSTFGRLATAQPDNPDALLALADAQIAARDHDAARQSATRALRLPSGTAAAQVRLARIALLQQRYDDAIRAARTLQSADPTASSAFIIEAEAEIARGNRAAAIAPLQKGVALAESAAAPILLHRTLNALGRSDDAKHVASAWLRDHPKDVDFAFYLGDAALGRGDDAAAEAHYRTVLQLQPTHALALNNIAWLMTRQGKTGAAAVAERANALLPDNPALIDTWSWALANENQLSRAIEQQERAIASWPDAPDLKLTGARIYLKAGDRQRARLALDSLARLGNRYSGQPQVAELMQSLR